MKHVHVRLTDEEYELLIRRIREESEKLKVKLSKQDFLRLLLLRNGKANGEKG